jgi:hypothetical protein
MADNKVSDHYLLYTTLNGIQVSAGKIAMSRALGAAFLNHQVEQLEKSVSSNGPTSGNWRDRKHPATGSAKRDSSSPPVKMAPKTKVETKGMPMKERDRAFDRNNTTTSPTMKRTSAEDKREKDADIIVVDASVLIHALYQVKKWCRDGRQEIVIVPLEGTIPITFNSSS